MEKKTDNMRTPLLQRTQQRSASRPQESSTLIIKKLKICG